MYTPTKYKMMGFADMALGVKASNKTPSKKAYFEDDMSQADISPLCAGFSFLEIAEFTGLGHCQLERILGSFDCRPSIRWPGRRDRKPELYSVLTILKIKLLSMLMSYGDFSIQTEADVDRRISCIKDGILLIQGGGEIPLEINVGIEIDSANGFSPENVSIVISDALTGLLRDDDIAAQAFIGLAQVWWKCFFPYYTLPSTKHSLVLRKEICDRISNNHS